MANIKKDYSSEFQDQLSDFSPLCKYQDIVILILQAFIFSSSMINFETFFNTSAEKL